MEIFIIINSKNIKLYNTVRHLLSLRVLFGKTEYETIEAATAMYTATPYSTTKTDMILVIILKYIIYLNSKYVY